MTFAPPTLTALASLWVSQGGVNLGIVGDTSHVAGGVSYHLGRDDLQVGAYSRQTARDRAGLTDAASAIDLGKLDGSYGDLRAFSKWLVAQARTNRPGTSDMREIIYSPDGVAVLRWDRQRGYASAPRSGEADNSHRGHTHVSWYRDAEARDHRTAFLPYFEGETVIPIETPAPVGRYTVTIPKGTRRYSAPGVPFDVSTQDSTVTGYFKTSPLANSGYVAVPVTPGGEARRLLFVLDSAPGVVVVVNPPPQPPPADCTAVEAERDAALARVAGLEADANTAIVTLGGTP